jgi:type III restriction enzyme
LIELKKFQQSSLEKLREYLIELNRVGPKRAFIFVSNQPYDDGSFKEVPNVCIKIPTGGGKTLVACYSIREIIDVTLKNKLEKGIALWFVPSESIKSQTLRKLKNRNDFHRRVLDEYFNNNVKVFSNEEALRIRRDDVGDNLCIVVSSLDAFRKEKKLQNKYKVYQENGELTTHFENLDDDKVLDKDEDGNVINSLANVIRLNNPLIVIDEGHRSKTELSVEFLNDLNPSFIIEFTATPRLENSNVLVNVHSTELKEEKMVKIPIILESVSQWQQAISRGVAKRDELEKLVRTEGEYIRPLVLLQAEQEKESEKKVTVAKIKEFLITEKRIPEEEIAIKTSSKNELDGQDLFSKKCKINYIITVNALAEGWDCSFAYVLISVANIGSRISVEQIIGRIIRLPNATEKKNEALNYSYVFASARNFNEAANQIVSGLESNGYSKSDIVDASDPKLAYESEVRRTVDEDLAAPMMAFENNRLEFSDLIGEDFRLSEQSPDFEFALHYDNDGRIKLDIKEGDRWLRERQTLLHLAYKDKNFSKPELLLWLDKKLRFAMIDKEDKTAFLENVIDIQLKKYSLSELSINRFVLKDRIDDLIQKLLVQRAKKRFDQLLTAGKISVKKFESFPESILISEKIDETFKKNYYEELEMLNKEELDFIRRLDSEALPNLRLWVRNREKKDPFYLQGWQPNKFYPDFVAVTAAGDIIVLEWKGKDRISNEDTSYKIQLAKVWEGLGKGKLYFFLVHVGNVEEVLTRLKEL